MTENLASAGNGPAHENLLEDDVLPATARLRAALGACGALFADCARVAGDRGETSTSQMLAAATASKLAAASALAASALARLADAETHQRLATAKIELALRPRRIAQRHRAPESQYDSNDWRATRHEMDPPNPANNPKVRSP